jgi:membrane protein
MRFATVYELLKRTVSRFIAANTFEMGAALAYYTVFSLAPLILIAVAFAGWVFGEKAAEGQISSEVAGAVGTTVANAIEETVRNARTSGGSTAASIVGIIVLVFGASGVFVQLQDSLNRIWQVPEKERPSGVWGFIRTRLLSFAMVLGIGFLLLVSLIISTALSAMSRYLAPEQTAFAQVLNQLISFGFITVLFAAIFKFLPDRPVAWNDVWIGAAFTSLLFVIGKYLIGLYLGQGSVTSAFGAAGSLVVILLWVYYASQILLFGAQFTQVYATQGEDAQRQVEGHASPERSTTETAGRGTAARSEIH